MLQKFYWSTTRKAVVAFGNMFNQITIDRRDADGSVQQTLRVPLGYAPKQKFLARIDEIVNSDRPFEVLIPRMAFEMIGIEYDSSRKINILHQNRKLESDQLALQQYSPVPYNIAMSLYIYVKNQDDGLQIIEQILPYFNPDFNLSLKAMPQLDINHDLPIVFNSMSYEDSYEGDFRDRRMIIWTLNFTIKMNYFGPVNRQGVIKKAIADIQTYGSNVNQGRFDYTATVDPITAGPNDEYTIIETFDEF